MAQRKQNAQYLTTMEYMSPARPISTSEVSQFKGNVHRHFTLMPRPYTNRDELRIGVVQVEKCELPKDFGGPPIGDEVLARNFVENGWSGAACSLLTVIINCISRLW